MMYRFFNEEGKGIEGWFGYPCYGGMTRGSSIMWDVEEEAKRKSTNIAKAVVLNAVSRGGSHTPAELLLFSNSNQLNTRRYLDFIYNLAQHPLIKRYITDFSLIKSSEAGSLSTLVGTRGKAMKLAEKISPEDAPHSVKTSNDVFMCYTLDLNHPSDELMSIAFLFRNCNHLRNPFLSRLPEGWSFTPETAWRFAIWSELITTQEIGNPGKRNERFGIQFNGRSGGAIHSCSAADLNEILSYGENTRLQGKQDLFVNTTRCVRTPRGDVSLGEEVGPGYINDGYLSTLCTLADAGVTDIMALNDPYTDSNGNEIEIRTEDGETEPADEYLDNHSIDECHLTEAFMPRGWDRKFSYSTSTVRNFRNTPLEFQDLESLYLSNRLVEGGNVSVMEFVSSSLGWEKC